VSTFRYHPDIAARFPGIVGGVILAHGISNGATPESLLADYQEEQQATLKRISQYPETDRRNEESPVQPPTLLDLSHSTSGTSTKSGGKTIGNTSLSQIASLAAWRGVMRGFGVDPTQYRTAAEALLRRLTKKGDIPSINMLVDLGNMISIRYALPVAIFDTRALQGAVSVHFADGSERYTALGQSEVDHPEAGEVIFSDESGLVIARRWCWRQGEHSAAQFDTTNVIITVEAHHKGAQEDITAALQDLYELLTRYTEGQFKVGILDKSVTTITDDDPSL
jgi:DNA/RNA-binding domain of Phe-tRNA-synthetase-like protein